MKPILTTLLLVTALTMAATAEPCKMVKPQNHSACLCDSTAAKSIKPEAKDAASKKKPERSFKDEMLISLLGFEK